MSVAHAPTAPASRSIARGIGTRRRQLAMLAAAAAPLLLLAVCAIAPGLLAPHDPLDQSLLDRNLEPLSRSARSGAMHLLGTDALGRDVLSRMIYGARISLGIGLASVIVSSLIGIPLGIIAGYKGGRLETLIMRVVDGMLSFPILVLCIFLLYVAGAGVLNLILVLALMRWMAYSRVARGLALSYRDMAFVEAARSVGCSDLRIMFRHILPNVLSPLLVLATLEVATVILAEASLSFLGLGVQPPTSSWGIMISEGRAYLATAWWLIVFPGLAVLGATVSLNVVATRMREMSDAGPQSRFAGIRARRAT